MTRAKFIIILSAVLVLTGVVSIDILVRTRPSDLPQVSPVVAAEAETGATRDIEKQNVATSAPTPNVTSTGSSPASDVRSGNVTVTELPSAAASSLPVESSPFVLVSPTATIGADSTPDILPDPTPIPDASSEEDDSPPNNESVRDTN